MSKQEKPDPAPFNNPFAALQKHRDELPPGPPPPQKRTPAAPPAPARAVVRLERTGRGGKEVTIVSHLALSARELETWLKVIKTGLGCGGTIEGDELVFQGDQRKRVPALLEQRGVRKITVGS